jgi:hypothetical protein
MSYNINNIMVEDVVLNHQNHIYNYKDIQADYSVTGVISKSTYTNKAMEVAAEVGVLRHSEYAEEMKMFVERNNIETYFIEKSFMFGVTNPDVLGDMPVHIGGTADFVYIDSDSDLIVTDFKTSTSNTISNDWKMQLAIYAAVWGQILKGQYRNIIAKIDRPGFGLTTILTKQEEIDVFVSMFFNRLGTKYPSNVEVSDEAKEELVVLTEQIDKLTQAIELKKTELKAQETILKEFHSTFLKIVKGCSGDALDTADKINLGGIGTVEKNLTVTTRVDTEAVRLLAPEFYSVGTPKANLNIVIQDCSFKI